MKTLIELKRLYLLLFVILFVCSQLFLNLFAVAYVERLLVAQRLEQNQQLVEMALDAVKAAHPLQEDEASLRPILQEIASKTYFNSESFVCFIDLNDNIVAHPNPNRIGLYRGDQHIETTTGPRPFTRQTDLVGGIWDNEQFSRVEIVSSLFDRDLGLTVAAHQNKSLVDQHLRTVRLYFFLFSVAVLGVLFGAAWWLTHTVVARYINQIERYEGDLEAFNSSVSHDLRGPLRSIDGFSRLLFEDYADKLDDRGNDYIEKVRSSCQRMEHLVEDLLRLSRAVRRELVPTRVDLSGVVEAIARDFRQEQDDRNVSFVIAPDVEVRGDADLLCIALENLIGNAWKYTSKRPEARIEFGVKTDSRERVYFVRDNGIGFDMQNAEKLFDAFQRFHHGDFEGSGIGLATVKRIIERHGGRVWAEGDIDRGATFFFALP